MTVVSATAAEHPPKVGTIPWMGRLALPVIKACLEATLVVGVGQLLRSVTTR